jgi:Ala-tRNA(Pro) deacylase
MIPVAISTYLRQHNLRYEHFTHGRAITAQRLAAAEHVSGARVAKVVVVAIDGKQALAIVSALDLVNVDVLRSALDAHEVHLVPEPRFIDRFKPCEAGAEPALSLFGLPMYIDAELARQPRILMRAGTHEDAIELDTDEWLLSERARIVEQLGAAVH